MNHLIVYSHPNPKSFNHAILEMYEQSLKEQGHEVKVRDLYAMGFDPVLSAEDLELAQRWEYQADVVCEQELVSWSEVVTFICPVWWGGLTANLRGYIDRVFASGFAYEFGADGHQRLLADKRLVLINTMNAPYDVYAATGMIKSMTKTIDECLTDFTGIQVAAHLYFGSVAGGSRQDRLSMLDQVRALAAQLC